ncbi:heme ABC exporter ATP-binding protein CcmA [Alicyclobacillus fodiniaquatilis]|uniref:Heme ABC exporter ATP-binding protein CcmA n=1 Tax=Alicyclobacillus fodiniaquatilis TaxID=1661150 RepID=A0ABW4JFT9_9BACL
MQIQSVTAGYGSAVVLTQIDLEFSAGFHVILGPNGSGKTTLFRVAAGILPPKAGQIKILGQDPLHAPLVKQQVGYLSHNLGLSPNLTVEENLLFWGKIQGIRGVRLRQSIENSIDRLHLSDILGKRVRTLSRGQLQRSALAQVLLTDPKLLFLDEPTTGLDPAAARTLRQLLRDITKDRTIIYSTHNLYEATELAQDITFLTKGRVVAQGSIEELRRQKQLAHRVGLRVKGDPTPIFASLQVNAQFDGSHWVFETSNEEETGRIVESLVSAKITVLELREMDNPLEELLLQLEEEAKK